MLAQWTGDVVGQLHQHKISKKQLAAEIGWNPKYLSQVLNGLVNPKGAEQKVRDALASLIPPQSPKQNPALELVREFKEVRAECPSDMREIADMLATGEWIAVSAAPAGDGKAFLFSMGRVSDCA